MQFSTIVPLCFCDARILRRRSDDILTPFSFALVIAEQQHLCDKFCTNCLVSCTQTRYILPISLFASPVWHVRPGVTCDTRAPG